MTRSCRRLLWTSASMASPSFLPAGLPVRIHSSCSPLGRWPDLWELKQLNAHQVVLFDLPSVLAFDDAIAFSPLVDCALLVIERGRQKSAMPRRALTRLEHTRDCRHCSQSLNPGRQRNRKGLTLNRPPFGRARAQEIEGSVPGPESRQTHLPVRLRRYAFECSLAGPLSG